MSHRRRNSFLGAVGVLLVVLIYLAVLLFYAWSSKEPRDPEFGPGFDPVTDAGVVVAPTQVVPLDNRISAQVSLVPPDGYADDTGSLLRDLEVVVSPAEGKALRFDKGGTYLSQPVQLRPGLFPYQNYPFDGITFDLRVQVFDVGAPGGRTPLPTHVSVLDEAPGFRAGTDAAAASDPATSEPAESRTWVHRSGSTVTVVVLLLLAMVVLAVVAVLVARSVVLRRRAVEATMASWFAAMLFAIVPLRTNLPGSPPIGVWIDFIIVLWVELVLMYALAVFIGAWLRFGRAPDTAPSGATGSPLPWEETDVATPGRHVPGKTDYADRAATDPVQGT